MFYLHRRDFFLPFSSVFSIWLYGKYNTNFLKQSEGGTKIVSPSLFYVKRNYFA